MTLPTRADGGIDWNLLPSWRRTGKGKNIPGINIDKMVAAHTRERCARWHIDQHGEILKIADSEKDPQRRLLLISIADEHILSADAHRKMED